MVSLDNFRKLALSFPDAEEQPHFHLASFRVKKKIFATLWEKENRAMLKLSLVDQSVFCTYHDVFSPVPGGWGTKGATFVDLGQSENGYVQRCITGCLYFGDHQKKHLKNNIVQAA
jgi:hypothetical protein